MEVTASKLAELLRDKLHMDIPKTVTDETLFATDLAFDSLDMVEAVMEVEDEYGITIDDTEAENTRTAGEFVALINRLLAEKK